MSKSDNAKDEIMTEQPLEENEKQHSASDKEDTGKKKTDGRQVKSGDQRDQKEGEGSFCTGR